MTTWAPNTFIERGRELGHSDDDINRLVAEGRRLQAKNLPVLFSLGHLAAITGVSAAKLRKVVDRRIDPYLAFQMKKKSGGFRVISVPNVYLLRVQRWIHQQILINQICHPASFAFNRGGTPYENARRHCGAKWLVKIDISSFFDSVSERQVYYVFRDIGYPDLLAFEMTRLVTRASGGDKKYLSGRWRRRKFAPVEDYVLPSVKIGHLPQGAPTSPMLANLVCRKMDDELQGLAARMGCTYTRYADDLAFSAFSFDRTKARQLIIEVNEVLSRFGFRKNAKKTVVVPPRARKVVTGLQVGGADPSLTSSYRDRIRQHLYYAKKFGVASHCQRRGFRSIIGFKQHLYGMIQYAISIEDAFGHKCLREFSMISWPPS